MTVHFIGAGPGAPDLLTLRGRNLIAQCDLCLYAGSLVPDEILAHCPPHAQKINTAPLNLEEIIKEIKVGIENGASIVRQKLVTALNQNSMRKELNDFRKKAEDLEK